MDPSPTILLIAGDKTTATECVSCPLQFFILVPKQVETVAWTSFFLTELSLSGGSDTSVKQDKILAT